MHLYTISAPNSLQSSNTLSLDPLDKPKSWADLEPSSKNKGQKMGVLQKEGICIQSTL